MRDFGKTKHIATRILDWTDGQRNVDPFSCFCNPSCERSCALSSIMGSTMLERDGKVLAVTGPSGPSDAKVRRAQSLAFGSEVGLRIARELISRKLTGQAQIVRDVLRDSATADEIARFKVALPSAESLHAIRDLESRAAAGYWLHSVAGHFPRRFLVLDENANAIT